MRVLMVCKGNICRSPTAEAALVAAAREASRDDIVVESRGTTDWHQGKGADPRTIAHAKKRGLDLSRHRARQVTLDDMERFDVVYAMDHDNRDKLVRLLTSHDAMALAGKIAMFLADDAEVPDPWYGGPDGFEHVLDLCQARALEMVAKAK